MQLAIVKAKQENLGTVNGTGKNKLITLNKKF
jgi:hypothetical protein